MAPIHLSYSPPLCYASPMPTPRPSAPSPISQQYFQLLFQNVSFSGKYAKLSAAFPT